MKRGGKSNKLFRQVLLALRPCLMCLLFEVKFLLIKHLAFVYILSISKYSLKDYNGAMADFNMTIGLKTTYSSAYTWRGTTYFAQAKDDNAIADFNKALELNPNDSQAFHFRGLSKSYKKDVTGACADLKKANTLGYAKSQAELDKLGCK